MRLAFSRQGDAVELSIHNLGVVPAGVRAAFFEKYATSGKVGGFGLGTYSARLMARVQEGELTMESSEEAGTTLRLRLPALPAGVIPVPGVKGAAREGAPQAPERPLPALRVLVVDDDEFNIAFVRGALPSPPLEVATAINGRAAVDAVRARPPQVVFMDIEMPVMNGFEAVGMIRAMEAETGANPPSWSRSPPTTTRRHCAAAAEAGFDAYLSKPAPRERIHDILHAVAAGRGAARFLRRRRGAREAAGAPGPTIP